MSATRDKSQKFSFVYSNLYQIYRQGVDAAKKAEVPAAPSASAGLTVDASEFVVRARGVPSQGAVLKSGDGATASSGQATYQVKSEVVAKPQISSFNPPELLGKRLARKPEALREAPAPAVARAAHASPLSTPARPEASDALMSLKDNLKALNDLHSRLRFMLQELEDLVKE